MQSDFLDRFLKTNIEFNRKYSSKLQELYTLKDDKTVILSLDVQAEFLKGKGINITEEEKTWISAHKELIGNPLMQQKNQFSAEHQEQIRKLFNDHSTDFNKILQEYRTMNRKEILPF